MNFNENYKFWLGGFIEGEGSLIISIVKSNKASYGILLQPEFNVAQHKNGLNILNKFKLLFDNKGQIHQKTGSNNVWVYSLKGTSNLINHIVPFYLKYIICYSYKFNDEEFNNFVFILNSIKNKNYNKTEFINLVKMVYNLNPSGKGKQRKRTLIEVIKIIDGKI
jgi:LAGLIDADG endonuclease